MRTIKLSNKTLYGYGIGNMGYGMALQAMTTYLVFFRYEHFEDARLRFGLDHKHQCHLGCVQ